MRGQVVIAGFLRGAADFIDAVQEAVAERRAGFSEREAGDFLDASGVADGGVPDEFMDLEELNLSRSSEPQSPVPPDHVVDAEVHCEGCRCPMICGCGRELYHEVDRPGALPLWFHRDDDSPVGVECGHYVSRIGEDVTCRCGEIFGDFSSHAKHLVDLERASRSTVRPDDLAAHITAIRRCCSPSRWAADVTVSDEIARDLLSDYHITRKK